MKRILVAYSTQSGQTAKIAEKIAEEIRRNGFDADTRNIEHFSVNNVPSIEEYDAIIAGAPVYYQQYPLGFRHWVKDNIKFLQEKPSAFFSVCLGILEKSNLHAQRVEREIVDQFFEKSNWHPKQWIIFPGALLYTKYNWIKRLLMKRIVKRAHGDTDTKRDYEYTDWHTVEKFAQNFSTSVYTVQTSVIGMSGS